MPGFVAPIKNVGGTPTSSSSQSVPCDTGSSTFSSVILESKKTNGAPKNPMFVSCLEAVTNAETNNATHDNPTETPTIKEINNLSQSDQPLETPVAEISESSCLEDNTSQNLEIEKNINAEEKSNGDIKLSKHTDMSSKNKTSRKNYRKQKVENKKRPNNNKENNSASNKTEKKKKQVLNKKKCDGENNEPKNDNKKKTSENNNYSEVISSQNPMDHSRNIPCSQASNASVFSKMVLSQVPKQFNHKQRMEWLQERRQVGLWVQCNMPECLKWRYLPHIHDPTDLPEVWYCAMNPDGRGNDCSKKEFKLKLQVQEDCIYGQYSVGSLVWAHLQGFPWWPAMVDDDPDTEQFYWLDGFSDIPTYYNVTFFDPEVSRAWLTPKNLKPFASQGKTNKIKNVKINPTFKSRLQYAIEQAKEAINLSNAERLKKYSFISLYKGPINSPKKVFKMSHKRSLIDSSDSEGDIPKRKTKCNKSSIAKMLESELSKSTMMSIEDWIQLKKVDLEQEIHPTSSSVSSKTSAEIPIQPKIVVVSSEAILLPINNHVVTETENWTSSVIPSTEYGNSEDINRKLDAVVPSFDNNLESLTETFDI